MNWLRAAYESWKGLDLVDRLGVPASVVTILGCVVVLRMVFRGGAWIWRTVATCRRLAPQKGLTADDPPPTSRFTGREEQMQILASLVEAHPVVAVTGPPLIGKSWLISETVRTRGKLDRCIFIQLKPKRDLSALLFAVNAGLVRRECDDFQELCRRVDRTPSERAEELRRILQTGDWLLILDAYERVDAGSEIDQMLEIWSQGLGTTRIVLGTRWAPSWLEEEKVLAMPPMPADEMKALCSKLGILGEEADRLCGHLRGLPGAVGGLGGLPQRKRATAAAAFAAQDPEALGQSLFEAAFKAAPPAARDVWMVACSFPDPLAREAARAICGEQVFEEGVALLERWAVLPERAERLRLHEWAVRAGERRLRGLAPLWHWRKRASWQRRAVVYFRAFALEHRHEYPVIEAEFENLLTVGVLDVVAYNILTARAPSYEEAQNWLKEMQAAGVAPNVVSYSTLISKAPSYAEAERWLKEMQAAGVAPNVVSYNTLISKAPDYERAVEWFGKMKAAQVAANVVSYNTLISKAPDYERAVEWFGKMEAARVAADVVSYSTLISKAPSYEEAERWFKAMEKAQVAPNVFTYSTLISKAPDYQKAVEWFGKMEAARVAPNVFTYSTLISKAPSYEEAERWFKEMKAAQVAANVVSYNTLISKAPDYQKAVEWFRKMEAAQVPPDVVSYSTLISKAPSYGEAERWFEAMEAAGVPPNVFTYSTLISKAPSYEEAERWFKEMKAAGVAPNVVSYTTLIAKASSRQQAREAFQRMTAARVRPNERTYSTLLRKGIRREEAEELARGGGGDVS